MVRLRTEYRANVPLIRAMVHEVTGVFDSGTIHPPGYAEVFAREHHIHPPNSPSSHTANE
ncbi:hypothetical protein [Paenibacillus sp. IITD108]|uniref:hypothetical protein n=1 Tax=Paenibacillus sp. IITD108 TaxID=3116649 RepID=UPI002F42DBF0